jgi:hypothetical protein
VLLEFGSAPFGATGPTEAAAPTSPGAFAVATSWVPPFTGAGSTVTYQG